MQNQLDKDNLPPQMKRAPSYGTVTTPKENLNWERSQSDANLTGKKSDKTSKNNVSDNDNIYWDLSKPDENARKETSHTGFQMALETIHQNSDEYFEYYSSMETIEDNLNIGNSGKHRQIRNSTACINSNARDYIKHCYDKETRKSCSALPLHEVNNNSIDLERINPEDKIYRKPPINRKLDSNPNYFCDSDYDARRECVPNYQLKLKSIEEEFNALIVSLELDTACANDYREFLWPTQSEIQKKTETITQLTKLLDLTWGMPNVGRDYATSLCNLVQQSGLLSYLTKCIAIASDCLDQSVTVDPIISAETSTNPRRDFVINCAAFFSQVLTVRNINAIMGLSSCDSQETTSCVDTSVNQLNTKLFEYPSMAKTQSLPREIPPQIEVNFADDNEVKSSDQTDRYTSSPTNNQYNLELFVSIIKQSWLVRNDVDLNREFIKILEALLKHDEQTSRLIVHNDGVSSLIFSCRSRDQSTLRHLAFALVNLCLYANRDVHYLITNQYRLAEWLFPLGFHQEDIVVRYYSCLAIVILASHRELTQKFHSSGTLELVLTFLQANSPHGFADMEPSHYQGRSRNWLRRLVRLLESDCTEAVAMASFHFVMEARIKIRQNKTHIFYEIKAIEALRKVASSTYREGAEFARQTLRLLNESLPYKLTQPVCLWSVQDVCHWMKRIGFDSLCEKITETLLDGDLLLRLDDESMKLDLEIHSSIVRTRLIREIAKLKHQTSYEPCDPSGIYDWIRLNVGHSYTHYTYNLIGAGVDRKFLMQVTDKMLQDDCRIINNVHRARFISAIEDCKLKAAKNQRRSLVYQLSNPNEEFDPMKNVLSNHTEEDEGEAGNSTMSLIHPSSLPKDDHSTLVKNIDVFISYRRINGSQLASLLMVHLRLRGYRVFLDIERLPGGKFNENLLQSIKKSFNFLLVLSPNCLDRCFNDNDCRDWVHKEVVCALRNNCQIIPVTDRFEFPKDDCLPTDMKSVLNYNAVNWVHDYQDACIDKIEQFMKLPPTQTTAPVNSSTSGIYQSPYIKCPFSPPVVQVNCDTAPPIIQPPPLVTANHCDL